MHEDPVWNNSTLMKDINWKTNKRNIIEIYHSISSDQNSWDSPRIPIDKECANFFHHLLTLLAPNDRQIEVINWHICDGPVYIDLSPFRWNILRIVSRTPLSSFLLPNPPFWSVIKIYPTLERQPVRYYAWNIHRLYNGYSLFINRLCYCCFMERWRR